MMSVMRAVCGTLAAPPVFVALWSTSAAAEKSVPGGRFVGKHIVATADVVGEMVFLSVRDTSTMEVLSPAEHSVASLVGSGLSYKEAARRLGVSPATVRNELHSVYGKLGITNKAALAQCMSRAEA